MDLASDRLYDEETGEEIIQSSDEMEELIDDSDNEDETDLLTKINSRTAI